MAKDDNLSVIEQLRNGEIQGIVCTNKFARGSDVGNIDHVSLYMYARIYLQIYANCTPNLPKMLIFRAILNLIVLGCDRSMILLHIP